MVEYFKQLPKIKLFTIDETFGGWAKAANSGVLKVFLDPLALEYALRPVLQSLGAACSTSTTSVRAVLPVLPINVVGFEVTADSSANRRKEEVLAEPGKQTKSFEFVLNRALHLGKAQLNAGQLQDIIQLGQHIG